MPLPVAHTIAAATVFKGLDEDGGLGAWKRLALALFIANSPDLDLIPGILIGDPNRYHHVGFSHSLVFAVFAGLVAGGVAAALGRSWRLRVGLPSGGTGTALMIGLLLASHVALDALNRDFRMPAGVPMFWPLSSTSVQLYPWFVEVSKLGGEGTPTQFIGSLLNSHNLRAMSVEAATLLPLYALVAWQRRSRRMPPGS